MFRPSRFALVWSICLLPALGMAAPDQSPEPSTQALTTLRTPVVVVPCMPAPRIDGVVDKAEWLKAAQPVPLVSAVTAEATEEPATYWLGYSEEGLHLAFRFGRPAYAPEPLSMSPPGVYKGDALEVLIEPPERAGDYDFCVNARGEGEDGLRTANTDRSWSTNWTHGARVVAGGWEGELSIPFACIGQKRPAPGTVWRLAVVRNRHTPEAVVGYGSFQKAWRMDSEFGYIRFGAPETPAVRVLAAGALTPESVGGELEIVGQARPARVRLQLAVYQPREVMVETVESKLAGETAVKSQKALNFFEIVETLGQKTFEKYAEVKTLAQEVDVPAEGVKRVPLLIPAGPGGYVFHFTATDAETGQLLGGGALPFRQEPACRVEVKPYLLTAGAFGVEVNYPRLAPLSEGSRFVTELLSGADRAVLASDTQPADLQRRRNLLKLPVKERFGQDYVVRTTLRDAQGKMVLEDKQTQRTPAKPEWLDNDIGRADVVLPPWTPIVCAENGDTAQVVLREYRLGANALPAAITARGKSLLAAPIDLTLGGRPLAWRRQLVSHSPTRVVWSAEAEAETVALKLTSTLEYDGMIRCDLTLTPRDPRAEVRELALEIPYRRDRALFGEVQGTEWGPCTKLKDWTDIPEFRPMAWVGDYDTGLYWFAEWARDWQIGKAPVFEKREVDQTLAWKVRMIGAEGQRLEQPVTLTFGLMAVPARDTDQAIRYAEDEKRYVKMAVPHPGPEITNSYLRYPVAGNLPPEEGALVFQTIASITVNTDEFTPDTSQILQIGQGKEALTLYLTKAWEGQEKTVLLLARGEFATFERQQAKGKDWQTLAKLGGIITANRLWLPVVVSWKRAGETVDLTLACRSPEGKILSAAGQLAWGEWQKLMGAPELRFGGRNFLAVDQVVVCRQARPPAWLIHADEQLPEDLSAFTLVDRLDRFRLSRGLRQSLPDKIANGRGGLAGGRYEGTGMFVRVIDGLAGRALLLPGGPLTLREVTESFGLKAMCPIQEQFHTVTNLEGFETAEDPILRRYYRNLQADAGVDTLMYSGLCFQPASVYLRDFVNDIAAEPRKVIAEGAFNQYKGSAAYADFHLWAWKRNVDYYGLNGIQMDNTLSVTDDASLVRGTGYYDAQGRLQPRYAIFGAREHAKRIRWLFHVYRQNGLIRLHAGARAWPMVADFTDMCEFGEGWYLGVKFTLQPPEAVWAGQADGGHYRLGYCQQVRNKPGVYPFGANYFYLYDLLFNIDLRGLGNGYNPGSWFIDESNPRDNLELWRRRNKQDTSLHGVYSPYYVKSQVKAVADPQALWRQLRDDFDLGSAEFVGFWRTAEYLRQSPAELRISFHLHSGRDALFVVANFGEKEAAAELRLDLAKLGLAGKSLWAFDAWTDEEYPLRDGVVGLRIPSYEYRLVRVEERP